MTRQTKPIAPAMAVGAALCAVCLILALWQGEWRWVPTGFIVLVLGSVAAGTRRSG